VDEEKYKSEDEENPQETKTETARRQFPFRISSRALFSPPRQPFMPNILSFPPALAMSFQTPGFWIACLECSEVRDRRPFMKTNYSTSPAADPSLPFAALRSGVRDDTLHVHHSPSLP
jgi:hypothetical protein